MKKNIIYYGNVFYPDKDASAQRTIGNAKALRELGYNVILIGCRNQECSSFLETKEIYEGFDIFYFTAPHTLRQWADYLFGFKPLKEIISIYDIDSIILYNHPSLSSNRIRKMCSTKGIKLFADCTEWYDPRGMSIHSIIKKADTWYRMRHVNNKLDGIIAISSYLQNYYRQNGCSTICVPPLVDLSSDKWKNIHKNNSGIDCTTKLIYVGNPGAGTKDKLDLIISTLKKIRSSHPSLKFHLNIIGMTKPLFEEAFKMDIGDSDFVFFLGRRPNNESLEMIKQCDFSIFLRDANLVCTAGFPTKFSESIACGTPVLTNLTSDIGNYLIGGKNGFEIDTTSFESTCNSLYKAISISIEKKKEMKTYCLGDHSFDYHSFIEEFKKMF